MAMALPPSWVGAGAPGQVRQWHLKEGPAARTSEQVRGCAATQHAGTRPCPPRGLLRVGVSSGQRGQLKLRSPGRHEFPRFRGARSSAKEEDGAWGDQQQWQLMEDVYDSLAQRILSLAQATPAGQKALVALAGPPGAGKSTVAHEVIDRVNSPQWRQAHASSPSVPPSPSPSASAPAQPSASSSNPDSSDSSGAGRGASQPASPLAVAVPMDGFHLYRWQLDCMPDPKEAHARRGAPWTFDPAALYRHLKRILDQGSGFLPSFNHGVGDPVERDIFVDPGVRVVLVEGNYLLLPDGDWAKLRGLFTETWFLDVDVDEAMRRVEDRHVRTGKPLQVAKFRVSYNDRPNAVSIMTTKALADVVVPSLALREP